MGPGRAPRPLPWKSPLAAELALPAAAAGLPVAVLSAASGGGTPTGQAVALTVLAPAAALVVRSRLPNLSRPARLMVGALVGLAVLSALSYAWSSDRPATVTATVLAAAIAAGALLLVASGADAGLRVAGLAGGTAAAVALIDLYSLSTRLLPGVVGSGGRHVGFNRLYAPVGYWNGLGALTAIGMLVTLGLIAHGQRRVRMAGCAVLVIEAPVLYLTFSRGSAAALVLGMAAAVALETRRLRFAACSAAAAVAPMLALLVVYLRPALTSAVPRHHAATAQGAEAAVAVLLLVVAGGFAGRWIDHAEHRIRLTPERRRHAAYALAGLALVPILAVLIAGGGPVRMARDVLGTAGAPAPTFRHGDLNLRYLSLSANGRTQIWRAALHGFAAHPLVGSGAGSFPRRWLRVRGNRPPVAQAHSVELSVLAELGIVGFALLVVALAAPVRSAVRMRGLALVPALGGAYTAFLLATGLDWTWQLAGVTMAGLACAAGLVSSDASGARRPSPAAVRGVLVAGVAVGVVGIVLTAGSAEISRAQDALFSGRFTAARAEAGRAARLQPWAAEPWLVAGYADLGENRRAAALADAHRALSADRGDVRGWILLACLSRGDARRGAVARARTLDPSATALSGPHVRCLPAHAALRRTD